MPILNTCCCCISTRTGTFIIGILDLIGALIVIITSILCLVSWETTSEEIRKQKASLKVDVEDLMNYVRIVIIVALVVCIVHVIIASLLIHGVKKMRPGLMLPFLFMSALSLILSIVMDVVFLVRGGDLVQGLVSVIVGNLLGIYFLIVVFSHYQELRDRDRIDDAPFEEKY